MLCPWDNKHTHTHTLILIWLRDAAAADWSFCFTIKIELRNFKIPFLCTELSNNCIIFRLFGPEWVSVCVRAFFCIYFNILCTHTHTYATQSDGPQQIGVCVIARYECVRVWARSMCKLNTIGTLITPRISCLVHFTFETFRPKDEHKRANTRTRTRTY